ncbi:hypothetical protein PG984_014878 [Apiospora sp. TS-2023a]
MSVHQGFSQHGHAMQAALVQVGWADAAHEWRPQPSLSPSLLLTFAPLHGAFQLLLDGTGNPLPGDLLVLNDPLMQ